jgi:hypothetical protein
MQLYRYTYSTAIEAIDSWRLANRPTVHESHLLGAPQRMPGTRRFAASTSHKDVNHYSSTGDAEEMMHQNS